MLLFLLASAFALTYRVQAYMRSRKRWNEILPIIKLSDFSNNIYVILPCRGVDPEIKNWIYEIENILAQSNHLHFIFIFDSDQNPAALYLNSFDFNHPRVFKLYSNQLPRHLASLKSEAQANALSFLRARDIGSNDLLVFMDADGCFDSNWFDRCVSEAQNHPHDLVTSYRYYKHLNHYFHDSLGTSFSDELLIGQLGGQFGKLKERSGFIWGGVMIARYEIFQKIQAEENLKTALIDDCTFLRLCKDNQVSIHFSPHLMRNTIPPPSLAAAMEFTLRQMKVICAHRRKDFMVFLGIKTVFTVFGVYSVFYSLGHFLFYSFTMISLALLQNLLQPRWQDSFIKSFFYPITTPFMTVLGWIALFNSKKISWRGVDYVINSQGKVLKRQILL